MSARATTLAQPVAGIQPGVQATARAGRRRARKARPALGLTGQVLSRGRSIKHLTNARRCGRFRGSWRRAGATGNEKAPACGPGRSPKSDVVLTDTKSMRGVRHGSGGGGSAMKKPRPGLNLTGAFHPQRNDAVQTSNQRSRRAVVPAAVIASIVEPPR